MNAALSIPVVLLAGIGFAMAAVLAIARKFLAVEVDERQEQLMDILPGANCGGCGYPGCAGYAAALVDGKASPTACPPGGPDLAQDIGKIMGVEVGDIVQTVALVACAGDNNFAPESCDYLGIDTCTAAHNVAGGIKKCPVGCVGLGTCAILCPFDAIVMTQNRLAVIIPEKCTGCGQCVDACPRGIIQMVPAAQDVHVLCSSQAKPKEVKAVCEVGCTSCKLCTKRSPQFKMKGQLAIVDSQIDGDMPSEISLVCPQSSIFDGREFKITDWTMDKSVRAAHEEKKAQWKEAEKAKKAAAKKAKEEKAAKAAAEGESK